MLGRIWTWPTIVAVLLAGITNAQAHVHFCFDGHDPAVELRFADAGDDPCEHAAQSRVTDKNGHDDLDVDVLRIAAVKNLTYDQPWIAPSFEFAASTLKPALETRTAASACPPPLSPSHLRPPLRGPPAEHF